MDCEFGLNVESKQILRLDQDTKPVMAVEYIYDTFQRCLDAANVGSDEPPHLPMRDAYMIRTSGLKLKRSAPLDDNEKDLLTRKRGRLEFNASDELVHDPTLPDMQPFPVDIRLEDIPPLCVERASPLVCVNQDIVRP